jgi:putative spermidine/putrescine transport system substrate-binding protein
LLEKLTEREVPNLKHVGQDLAGDPPARARPTRCSTHSLVYNKDKLDRPRSWADYWEPQKKYGDKVKGHVINYNPANLLSVYALIHAAQLGKGGVDNMDPAWARLKAQKPYVGVVVTGSAEAVPHFENGQVWISPYWSARSGYYIDRGLPFEMVIPEEGVIGLFDVGVRSGRREEQEARLRVPQLAPRPGGAARLGDGVFQQPDAPGDISCRPSSRRARSSPRSRSPRPSSPIPRPSARAARTGRLKWQEIMA